MKQLYRLAQEAFEKRNGLANGQLDKVYHMGHTDGYLDGFRQAREMAVRLTQAPARLALRDMPLLGESESEDVTCGAV